MVVTPFWEVSLDSDVTIDSDEELSEFDVVPENVRDSTFEWSEAVLESPGAV